MFPFRYLAWKFDVILILSVMYGCPTCTPAQHKPGFCDDVEGGHVNDVVAGEGELVQESCKLGCRRTNINVIFMNTAIKERVSPEFILPLH